ncbi:ABC transporter ATP-binding protein [Streptomyces sp. NPDC017529]|uniref:ABC transporter ATP-binding protein n=1 Tax=Streptomyces sp. NPDC017529 TaxID=3365000 RepID=UPI0037A8958C
MSAVIAVQNLHKKYGDLAALDDVSFTVEEGEVFGIVGPNGAGKTTALECIEGLRKCDGGEVRVLGCDPHAQRAEITQRLDVQLQDGNGTNRQRIAEALSLYSSFYRDPADWRHLMDSLRLEDEVPLNGLSDSQEQRLSAALARVGNPQVAVFDELTTGLDPQARHDTWEVIEAVRASGVTILLATDLMEEAERLCDRVALISKGRVTTVGTPSALIERVQRDTRITFRPSAPFDDSLLTRLPDVTGVTGEGDHVTVTGTTDVLYAVTSELARHAIVPRHLRVEQATLEDAFLDLTSSDFKAK